MAFFIAKKKEKNRKRSSITSSNQRFSISAPVYEQAQNPRSKLNGGGVVLFGILHDF